MRNKYYEDVKEVKELVDENLCYANGRMTPKEFINFIIAQKYNYNKKNCTITFKFAAIMTIYLATGTVWYDGTINKKEFYMPKTGHVLGAIKQHQTDLNNSKPIWFWGNIINEEGEEEEELRKIRVYW